MAKDPHRSRVGALTWGFLAYGRALLVAQLANQHTIGRHATGDGQAAQTRRRQLEAVLYDVLGRADQEACACQLDEAGQIVLHDDPFRLLPDLPQNMVQIPATEPHPADQEGASAPP